MKNQKITQFFGRSSEFILFRPSAWKTWGSKVPDIQTVRWISDSLNIHAKAEHYQLWHIWFSNGPICLTAEWSANQTMIWIADIKVSVITMMIWIADVFFHYLNVLTFMGLQVCNLNGSVILDPHYTAGIWMTTIWIQIFLKFGFQMVGYSNGRSTGYVLCTKPAILILDQYIRKQDGVHLSVFQIVRLSGVQMAFQNQTFCGHGIICLYLLEYHRISVTNMVSLHPHIGPMSLVGEANVDHWNTRLVQYSDLHCICIRIADLSIKWLTWS